MERLQFIRALIKKRNFSNYFEIGVLRGAVFFKVPAYRKTAVDPHFKWSFGKKIKNFIRFTPNIRAKYFEKKSDEFFASDAALRFGANPIDIALIDGMHEYQFALRDVENTLRYLQPDGVIFMHDCNPVTAAHAGDFQSFKASNFKTKWNGDVWKTIVHLRSQRRDINVFVLDCDEGLGVVTWGKPENVLQFTPEQIQGMSYQDLEANREQFLNLKPPSWFYEFFGIEA